MSATIIAAARGTDAHDAIPLAAMLARVYDARVLIAGVHVLPVAQHAYAEEHAEREALRAELDALSADVPGDVEFDIVMPTATSPIAGLHRLAEEHDALAIVLGPSHLGRTGRALRGDVGTHLMHEAPCAVAVAPAGYGTRPAGPPAVVGVAWDEGEEAAQAVAVAADLAHRTHARLRLVHVVSGFPAAARTAAADRLAEIAAAVQPPPETETSVLTGDVAVQLRHAGEEVDLLLAGSRGRGPMRRLLLGSVTSQLLHDVPCPLMVLPRAAVPAGAQA